MLLAATLSSSFSIDPTITDAVAAIVVSVTIVIAVLPLMYSLGMSVVAYRKRCVGKLKTKENYTGVITEADDTCHQNNEI